MPDPEQTFEGAMSRLAEIVRLMEEGNTTLQESLDLFEEGSRLARYCAELLDRAELRVQQLVAEPNGSTRLVPFGSSDPAF